MAEGSSPDDDKAIPWIASSKSSDQKQTFGTTMHFPEGLEDTPFNIPHSC